MKACVKFIAALALALAATGCVSLLPKPPPPPKLYVLEAGPAPASAAGPARAVVIAVAAPSTPRALGGSDIAWVRNGQLAYIEGAAWPGRAPDLLQTLLVRTIDRSGAVRAAVRTGEARADAEIGWDVSAFDVEEGQGQQARLAASVKLYGAVNRALIATTEIDERVALSDRSSAAAAAALQQAARAAAARIAAWAAAASPLGGASGQGASGQGAPGQGAPGQGAPGQGAPGQGALGQGASGQGAPRP